MSMLSCFLERGYIVDPIFVIVEQVVLRRNIFIIASSVDHGDWNLGRGGGIVLKNYMYVK